MTLLHLIDGANRQQFGDDDFPLAVALTDDGAMIAGTPAEPFARIWVSAHQGRLSIQPERGRGRVSLDGSELKNSAWLRDGARISVADVDIDVSVVGETIALTIRSHGGNDAAATPTPETEDSDQARQFGRRFHAGNPGRRGRPALSKPAKAVLALFALLSVGVAYVLASAAVFVHASPEPVDISLRGFPPPIRVGERYLALPGDYTIEARKPGYKSLRQDISVAFGTSPSYQFTLEKLPGLLNVATTPISGAQILVDGRDVGQSPLRSIEVAAGAREIRVVSDRYLPETRTLEVRGMGQTESLEIALRPGWGTLAVDSVPDKARATLNGKDIGETPLRHEPLQGVYDLQLTKEGWKPAARKIEIRVGAETVVPTIRMEKIDGTLDLNTTPSGATVVIDEKFVGQTPMTFPLVSDRDHDIKLSKQGYAETTRKVRVEGAKTTALNVPLQPEFGTIFLTTTPPGATLTVNGRSAGSATQRLSLQTLPQTLEISKPGHQPFKTTVSPRAGVTKTIEVRLKTLGEALKEQAQKGIATAAGQKMSLIYIASPVRFAVGASRREPGHRSNEVQYPVELTRSFLMSEKEVTNREFKKFKPDHKSGSHQNMSLDGDDQPAVNVSWDDAARYANWLSTQEKLPPAYKEEGGKVVPIVPPTNGYRLPTEAEWEFVSRFDGGQEPLDKPLRFPWGDSMPPPNNSGNYADDGPNRLPFAIPKYVDGYAVTAPVGKFAPNRSLIYDLGGNAAEWCHDYYDVPPPDAAQPLRDPSGPAQGRFHVIKGASWRSGSISELRLAYRDYAEKPRDDIGFRIVRYVVQTGK